MIVNAVAEGWEIIYQQAHGVLAAQLAYHLKPSLQSINWVETIIAIANHDNRQKVWQGTDGLTEAGAPADFTLLPPTLDQATSLMHATRFQSQWVMLLTSMHMTFIYEAFRTKNKDFQKFLDEQAALQKNLRQNLKINKEQARKTYAIMQWCDSLSLILCRNEVPDGSRLLEIAKGPAGEPYFIKQLENDSLQISPWPFNKDEVKLHAEYRTLEKLYFKNDEALAQALHVTQPGLKNWLLCK